MNYSIIEKEQKQLKIDYKLYDEKLFISGGIIEAFKIAVKESEGAIIIICSRWEYYNKIPNNINFEEAMDCLKENNTIGFIEKFLKIVKESNLRYATELLIPKNRDCKKGIINLSVRESHCLL